MKAYEIEKKMAAQYDTISYRCKDLYGDCIADLQEKFNKKEIGIFQSLTNADNVFQAADGNCFWDKEAASYEIKTLEEWEDELGETLDGDYDDRVLMITIDYKLVHTVKI